MESFRDLIIRKAELFLKELEDYAKHANTFNFSFFNILGNYLKEFKWDTDDRALGNVSEERLGMAHNRFKTRILNFIHKSEMDNNFRKYTMAIFKLYIDSIGASFIESNICISCKIRKAEWMDENDNTKVYCSHECARK